LVAAAQPAEGDLPSGALVYVGKDGKARELKFRRQEARFQRSGILRARQLLLIDGASAGVGRRVLLAAPDGRVRAIPGVEPPCAWWPAPAPSAAAPR